MTDFRDLLDGTTLSYSGGRGRVHPDVITDISGKARGVGAVHMLDNGAVGDGSTDDTAAWLAACTAANAEGRQVGVPTKTLITEGFTFNASTFGSGATTWGTPVFVEGDGDGVSVITWDPDTLSDDCIRFWKSASSYVGGGVRDVSIVNAAGTATGAGIRLTGAYRPLLQNVTVSGFLGTNGVGIKIDQENDELTCQHATFMNVHSQGNYNGFHCSGAAEAAFHHFNLNQSSHAQGVIISGQIAWYGGLIQGGNASLEFRPTVTNSIDLRVYGLHCEVLGVPTFKGYSAAGTYAGRLKMVDCYDNGNTTFVDADFYTTEIASYEGVAPIIAKLRSGVLFRATMCIPDPARYDLDATTLQYSTFTHAGNVTLGALPEHPALGGPAFALGGPAKFWARTTTQRNALSPAIGWTIFNTTTNALETWNGSTWV
jgi:hypothetical protein